MVHGDMLFTSHKDHKTRIWNMRNPNVDFGPKKVITLPSTTSQFKNYSFYRPIALQYKDIISCMAFNHVEGILLYTLAHFIIKLLKFGSYVKESALTLLLLMEATSMVWLSTNKVVIFSLVFRAGR